MSEVTTTTQRTGFSADLWETIAPTFGAIVSHPFLIGIADGSLPPERFIYFVGQDRLYLAGITLVIAAALYCLYRFTIFGIATRAATESERATALLGYSPDIIAAANWAIGCAFWAAGSSVIPGGYWARAWR